MSNFSYEVIETLGNISNEDKYGWYTALRRVSWNGGAPKLDIRSWNSDENAKIVMKKGVTLTDDMADALAEVLVASGYGRKEVLQELLNGEE